MNCETEVSSISTTNQGSEGSLERLEANSNRERLTDGVGEMPDNHGAASFGGNNGGVGEESEGITVKAGKLENS